LEAVGPISAAPAAPEGLGEDGARNGGEAFGAPGAEVGLALDRRGPVAEVGLGGGDEHARPVSMGVPCAVTLMPVGGGRGCMGSCEYFDPGVTGRERARVCREETGPAVPCPWGIGAEDVKALRRDKDALLWSRWVGGKAPPRWGDSTVIGECSTLLSAVRLSGVEMTR
jgi:hypothetical protein